MSACYSKLSYWQRPRPPRGRLGRPSDQAHAVLYLVSDEAEFVTGVDLRVDGGALATWGARTKFDPQGQPR